MRVGKEERECGLSIDMVDTEGIILAKMGELKEVNSIDSTRNPFFVLFSTFLLQMQRSMIKQ